jgi:hypothetical protein
MRSSGLKGLNATQFTSALCAWICSRAVRLQTRHKRKCQENKSVMKGLTPHRHLTTVKRDGKRVGKKCMQKRKRGDVLSRVP